MARFDGSVLSAIKNGSRFDFVELVKRGGSAYAEFAKPPAGLKVKFPDQETG